MHGFDDEAHIYFNFDIDESYDLNKVLLSIRITPVTLYRETIFYVFLLDIHEEMRCLSNKMI